MSIKTISLIAAASLMLQGCLVAGIGAGVGAWKYGDAEKEKAKTTCKNSYNDYLVKMENSNDELLTLKEYCPEKS